MRTWAIVITLFLDPKNPKPGTVRKFAAYNTITGEQRPQRDTHFEALLDIPYEHREHAVEFQ